MQVRDLIYLLQTRAKPGDEVYFMVSLQGKNDTIIQWPEGTWDLDFDAVSTEISHDEDEDEDTCMMHRDTFCAINLPNNLYHNLFIKLDEVDLVKQTNGWVDENGKRNLIKPRITELKEKES